MISLGRLAQSGSPLGFMVWEVPRYTRGEVDRAGECLTVDGPVIQTLEDVPAWRKWEKQRRDALDVLSNWRSSHSFPLQTMKMTLLTRAKRRDPGALIAQRLKRLPSITTKLARNPGMKLSRMQDIGGCRAVLSNVMAVDQLRDMYVKCKANTHIKGFVSVADYVANPKVDGYRSVHLIYKYSGKVTAYEKLRIEIQLRSVLQHIWATAVETASTFTGQALKANQGTVDWQRFFALMGTAIAIKENCPVVPQTPSSTAELRDELICLSKRLSVESVLAGWGTAVQEITEKRQVKGAHRFLLTLDLRNRRLRIRPFSEKESARAAEEYKQAEDEHKDDPNFQVVLVSVDALAALREAYPNYFLDTSTFLGLLHESTAEYD